MGVGRCACAQHPCCCCDGTLGRPRLCTWRERTSFVECTVSTARQRFVRKVASQQTGASLPLISESESAHALLAGEAGWSNICDPLLRLASRSSELPECKPVLVTNTRRRNHVGSETRSLPNPSLLRPPTCSMQRPGSCPRWPGPLNDKYDGELRHSSGVLASWDTQRRQPRATSDCGRVIAFARSPAAGRCRIGRICRKCGIGSIKLRCDVAG